MDVSVEIDFAVQKKESSTPSGIEDVFVAGRTPSCPCDIVEHAECSVNRNSLNEIGELKRGYSYVIHDLQDCRNIVTAELDAQRLECRWTRPARWIGEDFQIHSATTKPVAAAMPMRPMWKW